jgi:thioredoxin 1
MKKILKFSAEWCINCKPLSKMIESIELDIPIEEYDIDQDFELASRMRVRGVPTVILVENGEELHRKTGLMTKEEFLIFCLHK